MKNLINKYYTLVIRTARRFAKNDEDGLDIAHEAIVRMLSYPKPDMTPKEFRQFNYTVCKNAAIDFYTQRKKTDELIVPGVILENRSDGISAEDTVINMEEIDRVLNTIACIVNPTHRMILHLVLIEGYKYKEAAEETGSSIQVVANTINRFRRWVL